MESRLLLIKHEGTRLYLNTFRLTLILYFISSEIYMNDYIIPPSIHFFKNTLVKDETYLTVN